MEDIQTLLFFATQRSGHHAVMNWLFHQLPCKCIHYNDIRMKPFIRGFIDENIIKTIYKEESQGEGIIAFNFEMVGVKSLDKLVTSPLIVGKTREIIILRDIYNTVSSAIRKMSEDKLVKLRDLWIENAKGILEDKREHILFNRWFSDEQYRVEICEKMFDVPYGDQGLDEIPVFGDGSSFQKKKKGEPLIGQNLDVLKRYKDIPKKQKQIYTNLCHGSEIREMNEKLFGFYAV